MHLPCSALCLHGYTGSGLPLLPSPAPLCFPSRRALLCPLLLCPGKHRCAPRDGGWRIGWEGFSALCTKVAFVFIPSVVCCQQALCAAASFCVGLWWIFCGYASGLVPNLNNSGNAHAVPCLIPSLLLQELSVSFQARVCALNADKNTQRASRFCCLLRGSASCCGVGQALLRLGPVEGNSPRFLPPVHFAWRIKDQTGAFVGGPVSLKNEWIKEIEKIIYFFLLLFRRS